MALKKKIVVVVVDVEFIGSSNWKVRVGDQVERKLHPRAETVSSGFSFSASTLELLFSTDETKGLGLPMCPNVHSSIIYNSQDIEAT